jgi:hypothetical protein
MSSSKISFDIDTPSNGKKNAELPPFLTSVMNSEEPEPQAPHPISMSRGSGRVRGVWNECGQIVAIGHRPSPSPIWGRNFILILLLLVGSGILSTFVLVREQSLPELPSAPAQVSGNII